LTRQSQSGQLTIFEIDNGFKVTRKPNQSDAALMHVDQNIIALKAQKKDVAGVILQVYDVGKKLKLKNIDLSENVVFWTWASPSKLAVVTATSVYHVDVFDNNPNGPPVKVLTR